MIPYDVITAWSILHPWPTREQVEQDMLLSKAICEIYANELLARELIFRGGTALNKLILPKPYRYSEDLDFVRSSVGGIGNIMSELTELGKRSGYTVTTRMGQYPKIYWNGVAQTGHALRIKIEINTYERNAALPIAHLKHSIRSDWFSNESTVRVFQGEEIAATKLRALFQRAKGRDLFDLWLLTNVVRIDTETVLQAFEVYRPEGYTLSRAIENLEKKLLDAKFVSDINNLVSTDDISYRAEEAAVQIIELFFRHL